MKWLPTLLALALFAPGQNADLSWRVQFAGLGLPGATVTASRSLASRQTSPRTVTTSSDADGNFRLSNLEDGVWTLRIEMQGFVTVARDVTIPFTEPALAITLTMRPYEEIVTGAAELAKPIGTPEPAAAASEDPTIIHGTVTNGAATPFAQSRAMGNNRPPVPRRYRGTATTTLASSALNARPYSFGAVSVQQPNQQPSAARPDTSDVQFGFTLNGPLPIPGVFGNGPNMTLSLDHGVSNSATTLSANLPTEAERRGDFSRSSTVVRDPLTGMPFSGNAIPLDRISPQAAALLAFYPLPTTSTASGANFERPIVTTTRQLGGRFQTAVALSRRDRISWDVSGRRTATDSVNLFDFTNRRHQTAIEAGVNWSHTVSPRLQLQAGYRFTRRAGTLMPFFANRINVSGDAGIAGNEQSAVNWGPPALLFPGIADLDDGEYQQSSTVTHAITVSTNWRRGRHSFTAGVAARPTAVDIASQPDPRGTLSFTGAATGDAFADFLVGMPTTSAIAFSTTETRLRGSAYDAYVSSDFRVAFGITVTAGVRWEYETPFTERANRLVNLDVATDFSAAVPVPGSSLLRPDRTGIQPRVAASWRPSLGSTFVLRAGYGVYRNLGSYQSLAQLLAQQPPFSRTFSLQSTAATPLTLANPFPASLPVNTNTVAIDPAYKPASVHSWQVTAQRDFPASMTASAGYFGDTGTDLMQAFLPNTQPAGASNPCPLCPSGFVYITSNGSSKRHAVQLTVRRRLRNGFTAGVQYTLARATDNAATFSNQSITPSSLAIAQDWRNLDAERAPSSFDRRHLVSAEVQYSTGAGLTGGTLTPSAVRSFFRGWTMAAQLEAGSGLPFTPVTFAAIAGTGFVGVRPRLTGVSLAPATPGAYANAEAYAAPLPGTWGDAGRNSIRGPSLFSLNMTLSKVFQLPRQLRIEWRINATNVLNRVTFSAINTMVTSPQFGQPTSANAMRRILTSLQFRF